VGASSDASLGLTVVDLANAYLGDGDLTWYDGTTTTLHLTGGAQTGGTLTAELGADSGGGELCTEAGYMLSTDDGRLNNEPFSLSSGYGFGVTVLVGGGTTLPRFLPATAEIPASALRGSFELPSSWGAAVALATLTVDVSSKVNQCETLGCGLGAAQFGPAPQWAWSTVCGYDGKLSVQFDRENGCPEDVAVATWRWR
jgi:hypothetical protein